VLFVRHGPPTARGEEEDRIARVDSRLQATPGAGIEEIAAGGRHGRERGPDLDEGVTGPGCRDRIRSCGGGAGEGALHLGVRDDEPLKQTRGLELRPGARLEQVCADAGDEIGIAGAGEAELRAGDAQSGGEHGLVDDAQRGSGLGDAVEHDRPAAFAGGARAGAADLHVLIEPEPLVLREEADQRLLAETSDENRLMLREQSHVDEGALRIDGDEEVEGRSREARDGREVHRLEDVADEVRAEARRPRLLEDGPDGRILLAFAHDVGRRERLGEPGAIEDAGAGRCRGERHDEPGREQPREERHPRSR
jgi:hypothetical protein